MIDKTQKLKPWAAGPLELIRHGEEHRKLGGDFDRRMALISFDNAIEVSISTFLNLHPIQRAGREIGRKAKEEWLANYHKKLEFLESYCDEMQFTLSSTIDEIIFYHNLRNELYHSGNGFVPEEKHLKQIRRVACCVFKLLFSVDAESVLESQEEKVVTSSHILSQQSQFMEAYIDLEKRLLVILQSMDSNFSNTRMSVSSAWDVFAKQVRLSVRNLADIVMNAVAVRNMIAHGRPTGLDDAGFKTLATKVAEVSEFVSAYTVSIDLLPELKVRYSRWLRDEVVAVRIVQKMERSFLETTSMIGKFDEKIERMDLSFIAEYERNENIIEMFDSSVTAEENARKFLNEFDAYSIAMTTNVFREDAFPEIKKESGK